MTYSIKYFLLSLVCMVMANSAVAQVMERQIMNPRQIKLNSGLSAGLEVGMTKPTTLTLQSPVDGEALELDDDVVSNYTPYARGNFKYVLQHKHMIKVIGHYSPLSSKGFKDRPFLFGERDFRKGDNEFDLRMMFFRLSYGINILKYEITGVDMFVGPAVQHNRFLASVSDATGEDKRSISATMPLIEFGVDWEFMPINHIFLTGSINAFMDNTHQEAFIGYGVDKENFLFKAGYRVIRSEMNDGELRTDAFVHHAAISAAYIIWEEPQVDRKEF